MTIDRIGIGFGTVHIMAERRKSPIAHMSKPMKLASILPAVVGAFMFISWFKLLHFFNAFPPAWPALRRQSPWLSAP